MLKIPFRVFSSIAALKDSDLEVRRHAGQALGRIGAEAKTSVPELIAALKGSDARGRNRAAKVLGQMRAEAKAAVPELIALLKDSDADVRRYAAEALGLIGAEAKAAVPGLIAALKHSDTYAHSVTAEALVAIAQDAHDKRDVTLIPALKLAAAALVENHSEKTRHVVRNIQYLEAIRPTWHQTLLALFVKDGKINSSVALPAAILVLYFLWFLVLRFVLLGARPLTVLRWNEKLAKLDWKLPKWLGEATVPFRNVLLVGLYRDHPRVLDSWVAEHMAEARRSFSDHPTNRDRRIYVPLPVVVNGKRIPELKPEHLQKDCAGNLWCMLIRGEGGLGKTTLACQLAFWAMADDPNDRLIQDRRMLPVLIEPGLGFDVLQDVERFRREIRGRLQRLVAETRVEDELLENLLRSRRVMVIVDGLSEMPSSAEGPAKARLENPDFPVAALLVTSRAEERLGQEITLVPSRVDKERLAGFMSAYVAQAGNPDLEDSALFDACRRLANMLSEGGREATPLLAKLYAEELVTLSVAGRSLEMLPTTIPDLMLGYVSNLNRHRKDSDADNPTVHRAAQIVAWHCLKGTFRPGQGRKTEICLAFEETGLQARLLAELEHRLHLVSTVGAAEAHVTFSIDPLSEYLAALHVVDQCRGHEDSWEKFFTDADGKPGSPDAIRGFLQAARDCCVTKEQEFSIPQRVLDNLSKGIGLDPEAINQAVERRLQHLISTLKHSEEPADRLHAVQELRQLKTRRSDIITPLNDALNNSNAEVRMAVADVLGQMGAEAKEGLPALIALLKGSDDRARNRAAKVLGQMRAEAKAAVPELIALLKDSDADVRLAAATALAKIGAEAKAAVPALIPLLKDSDGYVRMAAGDALREMGAETKDAAGLDFA